MYAIPLACVTGAWPCKSLLLPKLQAWAAHSHSHSPRPTAVAARLTVQTLCSAPRHIVSSPSSFLHVNHKDGCAASRQGAPRAAPPPVSTFSGCRVWKRPTEMQLRALTDRMVPGSMACGEQVRRSGDVQEGYGVCHLHAACANAV